MSHLENVKRMNIKLLTIIFTVILASAISLGDESKEMRLVSYNIRHCSGADKELNIQRIADIIAKERPDIVGLNEVDKFSKRSKGVDQAKELGKKIGLYATFAEAIPIAGGSYGNAILSREKPLSVMRIPLPGKESRVLLFCEFSDCWFGSTHLSLQETNRIASARIINKLVREKSKTKKVFLSGDFNDSPSSKTLSAICEEMKILSDQSKATYNAFKDTIFDNSKCIDYIAIDREAAKKFRVKSTRVRRDAISSDHNLISVTLVKKQ